MSYAIRLTYEYVQMEPIVKRICDEADVVVVYQHDESERKHIHLYTEGLKATVQTVKNWINRELGLKVAKSDWSFKTAKNRNFITYMSKGKLTPCLVKGVSDAEIDTFREKWVEPIRLEKGKAIQITTWTMAKELAEYLDEKAKCIQEKVVVNQSLNTYVRREQWIEASHEDVIKKCIEIHVKHEKSFCDFSLIRVIQTAWGITSRETWKNRLVNGVMEKLFPTPRI